MNNSEKLVIIASKVLRYKIYKETNIIAEQLIYTATVCGFVFTRDLEKIEVALCKKLNLDYIEISRKYYNLESIVDVDDIIFKEYEHGFYIKDYNVDTIKFKKENYREISETYDEYVFDDDDTEF